MRKAKIEIDSSYERAQKYLQEHREDNKEYWNNYISQIEERADLSGLLSSDSRSVRISEYKHIKESREQELEIKGELYYKLKELSQKDLIKSLIQLE